jgi:transitional endoplasmic reticulum ATPase
LNSSFTIPISFVSQAAALRLVALAPLILFNSKFQHGGRRRYTSNPMSELQDLITAAGASPKSSAILRAVLRAAANAVDPAPALEFLSAADTSGHDEPTYLAVAGFLLNHKLNEAALRWCLGDGGPVRLMRARAHLALGQMTEARDHYAAALAQDANLRSDDLDEALVQRAGQAASGTVVQLRPQLRSVPGANKPDGEKPSARPRVTFADIGGLEDVKAQIRRKIILPFEKKSLFDRFRKRAGGGVLLYGPPGCGKTLLARATAAECNAKFIPVEIAEVLSMWIGESEKRLAHAFEEARAQKPSVLFFDEIEALAARRRFSEGDHKASMVSTFLNEFDGFNASNDGVLVLAATNVPWAVDPAFRRNGRFDRTLFVPPPDRVARKVILDIELNGRPQAGDIDTTAIAERTSGYSGADLANIVETACDLAIEESIDQDRIAPIGAKHLTAALKEVKPTTLEWLSQARNYAKFANEGGLYDDVVEFLDKFTR